MRTLNLNLELIPNGFNPVVCVSQADHYGTLLNCYLFFNGSTYPFDKNNTTFKLRGIRPDGHKFESIMNKLRNEYVYCNLTDEMTAVAGDVYCNIEMIENEVDRTGSQAFFLRVQPAARGEIE